MIRVYAKKLLSKFQRTISKDHIDTIKAGIITNEHIAGYKEERKRTRMSESPSDTIHLIHVSDNLATVMTNTRNSITVEIPTNEILDFIMDQCKSEDRIRIQALIDQESQNS